MLKIQNQDYLLCNLCSKYLEGIYLQVSINIIISIGKSTTRMNFNNVNPATGLPGHQVLSLDKNCLTCSSGGIPFAMSAFKIACLSYTPSVVQYEKGTLSRKHLIDIKGSLLDLCADNLNNFDTSVIDNAMRKLLFYVNS